MNFIRDHCFFMFRDYLQNQSCISQLISVSVKAGWDVTGLYSSSKSMELKSGNEVVNPDLKALGEEPLPRHLVPGVKTL